MQDLGRDIRIALRTLAKAPAYTFLAIVTIGLGIGATTAVFSMVNGVLLRRLPYGGDDRLVRLSQPSANATDVRFSPLEVVDYGTQVPEIAAISEYHSMPFQLYGHGEPQRVQTGVVSDNFFSMLGVRALVGRLFLPGEEAAGAEAVLVLSYRYWMEHFGGDPKIVGEKFTMNDRTHTIVGVLPPLPPYPGANDVWMAIGACPFRSSPHVAGSREHRMVQLVARLQPGATYEQASRSIGLVSGRLQRAYPASFPADQKLAASLTPLRDELTRGSRPLFVGLLATAGFVLLIAAANFANLTLVRQFRRGHEIALRSALGAGRARILRQLVTESLCITLAGGVVAILVALSALGLLRSLAARVTARAEEITIDPVVLGFALSVSVVVGLVVALVPLARVRPNLIGSLRSGAASTIGGRGDGRARNLLVAVQVAVAYGLLVAAWLMTRSLLRLEKVDGGYDPARVMTARVDLNWSRYTSRELARQFADGLVSRVGLQPGVAAVAVSTDFPLANPQPGTVAFQIRGRETPPGTAAPRSDITAVSPQYFRTIGIPVVKGRVFTEADRDTANVPAIIGMRLAATHWPAGRDPMGERISVDEGETWLTIVGIVGDVRQNGLSGDITDEIYVPFAVSASRDFRILVRTNGDPAAIAGPIRAAVRELDDKQPVTSVQTLEQLRGVRLTEPRVTTALIVSFAVLALVITAGGLAGAVGYSVSQRTSEIGIRVALGAAPPRMLWMVMREGLGVVVLGLLVGVGIAAGATRFISGLLFSIAPTNAPTYAGVAVLFVGIAAGACLVPARRALRVDPVRALRSR